MLKRLFPPGVVLLCAVVVCAADEKPAAKPDPAVVRMLIDDLKSDDFETRDRATKELSKLEEVPDALREATKSNDAEVRRLAESAIETIKSRAEERAFKALVADLQNVEVDAFVRRMVTDKDFAGDKQWDVVQKVTKAVTAKSNELGGKKFKVPDPDMKSLPLQRGAVANEIVYGKQRLLLNDPKARVVSASGCVILSAGPTPRVTELSHSVVIVDGDFTGCTCLDNCLLIVRGDVGRINIITNSVILATGEFKGATACSDSFVQVGNPHLRFTGAKNNVYVKTAVTDTGEDKTSRVLDTDRGPLQLLKFSEMKKDEKPKDEKK
jgi:hypothetical protein